MPFQTYVKISSIYEKLTANNNQALNWFCRTYCVRCAISHKPDYKKRESHAILHLISWKDDKLANQFMQHMETYARNPWLFDVDLKGLTNEKPTYLFIDGSNISAAVKNRFHILFDYQTILDVVSFECHNIVHKEVVESFLSHHVDKREAMWDDLGVIPTILPVRPGEKEEIVDELLHEAILDQLRSTTTPGHLVLLSGDGNWNLHPKKNQYNDGDYSEDSEGDDSEDSNDDQEESPSSFPKVIEMALHYGWSVDVWSMKHSCSKTWVKFQETYPEKFRLQYINSLLRQCVFPMDFDEAKSISILAKKRAGHMESILFHPESFA
jgi:hypothetical protein